MADDKQPRLDPSDSSDHEATEPDDVAADQADNDSDIDSDIDEHPSSESAGDTQQLGEGGEFDAETRMLNEIAALDDEQQRDEGQRDDKSPGDNEQSDESHGDEHDDEHDDAQEDDVEQTKMITPVAAAAGGTSDDEPPETKRRKRRRWPWIVALIVVLLGAGYVGAAFATQDTLPATLTVEDIDVSGMSIEEATPVLEEELGDRAQREVVFTADQAEASIVPADAGFEYDVAATVNDLTELTVHPVNLWSKVFGEAHVSAETSVDESQLEDAVAGLAEQLTYDPTEGSVAFEGDTVDYSEPADGFSADTEQLSSELSQQWLGTETEFAAPGDTVSPTVSQEQWDEFVAQTAQPLVDDAYTVTAGDETTELTPTQLGSAAEVRVEDGEEGDAPVLSLDGEALTDAMSENNSAFESTNEDASIELTGSAGSASPEVIPGSSGRGVDGEQVVDEILADLTGEQTRSVSVDLHEVEPDITTEDAEAWDVNHVVAEYSTPYPASDGPRTANLEVGAQRVNGTVVMPGDEFNLDALLAPVTEANGYHSSGVVESGVTTNAIGGGLSQIATMAYNSGFLGGMDIVEHKPHSRWFDRYPQGRESTYWEGQINVRWANDTDAPVIVEMWLADSEVHTRLWGSDYYDVETSTSEPYNFTASPTIRSDDDECIPESGGDQGFTVDVHRSKTPPDGGAIQESWSWAYSGWPTVICE